jgi:hypothetical protein
MTAAEAAECSATEGGTPVPHTPNFDSSSMRLIGWWATNATNNGPVSGIAVTEQILHPRHELRSTRDRHDALCPAPGCGIGARQARDPSIEIATTTCRACRCCVMGSRPYIPWFASSLAPLWPVPPPCRGLPGTCRSRRREMRPEGGRRSGLRPKSGSCGFGAIAVLPGSWSPGFGCCVRGLPIAGCRAWRRLPEPCP